MVEILFLVAGVMALAALVVWVLGVRSRMDEAVDVSRFDDNVHREHAEGTGRGGA